ncbi:glycerophosphodiester phosphodiesterase family protein [Gordonia sp. ABSL1-1]|uniref:glycerophosphodiester phosphodiesterase n=1 Tax=Gordonia sp. ABSL1-1 TaxID=3053923 RepID=UPI002573A70B|nr:glycerophosphodiester phosphodiesterase family protein [Gordonia sp. ABSL1-1]MDL9936177.1 glycerophosphodiester phosphodiesterase family protein [Gordonia sp. ABSL1-1]
MPRPPEIDTAPRELTYAGHRTRLKWHRARRRADDPPFTGSRIAEGMRVGASVEVDLLIHADRGFAVLHDRDVEGGTTGTGLVSTLSTDALRSLYLRDARGRPLAEPVLLLEDLADLLADVDIADDAVLQLDFKEDAAALDDTALSTFERAVKPLARHLILSCGDATAVTMLTDAAPGVRVGYDPCHQGAAAEVLRTRDFDAFVARAVAASPRAEMIYLENRLIIGARDNGYDLIAAFHATGRQVDGYTVTRVDRSSTRLVRRLLELGIDQITTDDPEGLQSRFRRRSRGSARRLRRPRPPNPGPLRRGDR